MNDPINPAHYKQGSIEFIDAMEIVLTPEEFRGFLKGNAMKYLWREKKKQGIEDLRKAKWYLDRMVASFDETTTEASGVIDEPSEEPTCKPSNTQPPSGYRLLGPAKDHARFAFDLYWSISGRNWTPILINQVEDANRDNWTACRKIKTPSEPPKYREPTKDDLRDGPIECEYRDSDDEQWRSGFLIYILNGAVPFLCVNKEQTLDGQWNQCRIEEAE